MPELREVIRWTNGMVMVFDAAGDQVTDLQGRYEEVKDAVLRASGPAASFYHAKWGDWKARVERDEW